MKRSNHLLLLASLLALLALACQVAGSPGGDTGGGDTEAPPQPNLLFQDDFSDANSGWDRIQDADGINDYHEGGYRIQVNKVNWYFWSNPGLNFSDVIIDVDATKIGGPDENDLGVICRYKDDSNFYFITISSDGYYGVNKFLDGEQSLVGMDALQFNDTIVKTGSATNHIQVKCIGSSLTLIANGQVLADVSDTDFAAGDVGLIVGTYDTAGADILFDNFVVAKP